MGLLSRPVLVLGVSVAVVVAFGAFLVAPVIGLDSASLVAGVVIGLVVATAYLVLRVLEPVERSIKQLNAGELSADSPLGKQCASLLADAKAEYTPSHA